MAKLKANPTDQLAMAQLAAEYLQVSRPDVALQYTQHLLQMGDKTAQVYLLRRLLVASSSDNACRRPTTWSKPRISTRRTSACSRSSPTSTFAKTGSPTPSASPKRAVTFNKTEPAAIETLGSVYAAEQHFDDARAQFEAAYALNPKDTGPLFQIATTYAQQDNIPMALQTVAARVLAVDPRNVQALVFKADLYARQHDDARTSEAYDDAVVAARDR